MKRVTLTLWAGICCALFASTAWAQTAAPSSGLGQSWPNATDMSSSPNWHVYVFYLNGIKYIQVNDLNGTVHAAVGTASGTTIVLPVGVDSQNVQTGSGSSSSSSSTVIYSDTSTTVTAAPQSDGTTQFQALSSCGNVLQCGGGAGS